MEASSQKLPQSPSHSSHSPFIIQHLHEVSLLVASSPSDQGDRGPAPLQAREGFLTHLKNHLRL